MGSFCWSLSTMSPGQRAAVGQQPTKRPIVCLGSDSRHWGLKNFAKHLPYEIEMLRLIHETLHQPYPGDAMANSLIECFCIRARNLIDFFNDCKPPNSKNSVARHFTDSAYSPFRSKSRVW